MINPTRANHTTINAWNAKLAWVDWIAVELLDAATATALDL